MSAIAMETAERVRDEMQEFIAAGGGSRNCSLRKLARWVGFLGGKVPEAPTFAAVRAKRKAEEAAAIAAVQAKRKVAAKKAAKRRA